MRLNGMVPRDDDVVLTSVFCGGAWEIWSDIFRGANPQSRLVNIHSMVSP
jgi:hypothetical protein